MIALDDFAALQRQVERLKQERDQARGALAALKERLKKEFNCQDLAAARDELERLKKKEHRLGREYTTAKQSFEQKYADVLEEVR